MAGNDWRAKLPDRLHTAFRDCYADSNHAAPRMKAPIHQQISCPFAAALSVKYPVLGYTYRYVRQGLQVFCKSLHVGL